jgi:hypothetical protein
VADDIVSKFGTDEWLPKLSELCFNYQRNLQMRPGGQYLRFKYELLGTKEKPGAIVDYYHISVDKFKKDIYDIFAADSHIDHHKIAALYMRSFLSHQPFINDIPEQTKSPKLNMYAMLPNEYFVIPFLATVFKTGNRKMESHTKNASSIYEQLN